MSSTTIPAEDIGSYPVLVNDLKGLLTHVEAADPNMQTARYEPLLVLALLGIEFVKSRNNNIVSPQSISSMMRRYSVVAPGDVDYVVLSTPIGLRRCPLMVAEQPATPAPDELATEEMTVDPALEAEVRQAETFDHPGAFIQMKDEDILALPPEGDQAEIASDKNPSASSQKEANAIKAAMEQQSAQRKKKR